MSHPNPSHDPENVRVEDYAHAPRAKALHKKSGKTVKPFAGGIKGLKQMINQPASKHWFARHDAGKERRKKILGNYLDNFVESHKK